MTKTPQNLPSTLSSEPHLILNKPKRIVFLALSPVVELDLSGPITVFQYANHLLSSCGQLPAYEVTIVTDQMDCVVAGACGMTILAHAHYSRIEGEVDTLLVPASGSPKGLIPLNDALIEWFKSRVKQTRRVGSICGGTFTLAQAGLLNGRRATTHWSACEQLAMLYPEIKVDEKPIWVKDGNVYTSAGGTAGIDLALHLLEEDLGSVTALQVARGLVVYLQRVGGQAPFTRPLPAQAPAKDALVQLQDWILRNLHLPLTVNDLAAQAAMSPRNFARVFSKEFGLTPARYILLQRLEAARQHLEQANDSQEAIAAKVGFGTTEPMRRVFLQELGMTPGRYRSHFRNATMKPELFC